MPIVFTVHYPAESLIIPNEMVQCQHITSYSSEKVCSGCYLLVRHNPIMVFYRWPSDSIEWRAFGFYHLQLVLRFCSFRCAPNQQALHGIATHCCCGWAFISISHRYISFTRHMNITSIPITWSCQSRRIDNFSQFFVFYSRASDVRIVRNRSGEQYQFPC